MSARTYTQPDIAGGGTVVSVRAWRKGEMEQTATRRLSANGPYKRLLKLQKSILAARDAAGGWDAYFAAGGLAAFRGTRVLGGSKPVVDLDAPPPTLTLDEATKRLHKAERALLAAQEAFRAAAASSLPSQQIARRAGPQWFASMYRALRRTA